MHKGLVHLNVIFRITWNVIEIGMGRFGIRLVEFHEFIDEFSWRKGFNTETLHLLCETGGPKGSIMRIEE